MAINLEKVKSGEAVNLQKIDPDLKVIDVIIGWKKQIFDGKPDIDADVSVFALGEDGKVRKNVPMSADKFGDPTHPDFIFYNHLKHPSGAIVHSGDVRDGGEEKISIFTEKMPSDIVELAFVVTIFNSDIYTFGQIKNMFARIDNAETGVQLRQFDLEEEYSKQTAVELCSVYKKDGTWRFKGHGNGLNQGLGAFVKHYGLDVK